MLVPTMTLYLKRSTVEQLAHAVDLMQKQYPVDPKAAASAFGNVVVTGEKLLSDVTLKPALTVQGVVQIQAATIGRPVELPPV
eukprot:6561330-Prymnesium_polylepis.1